MDKPRYVMSGPNSVTEGEPSWVIIDTRARSPKSPIVEWVRGRDNAQRRLDQLNGEDRA